MAENENLASILVKSGLISIFTNLPLGYFSKVANDLPDTRVSIYNVAVFYAALKTLESTLCCLRGCLYGEFIP